MPLIKFGFNFSILLDLSADHGRARIVAGFEHSSLGGATHRLHNFPRRSDKTLRFNTTAKRQETYIRASVRQVMLFVKSGSHKMLLKGGGLFNLKCINGLVFLCSQVLIRSRILRENGKYIPKQVRHNEP